MTSAHHTRRAAIHDRRTTGERVADGVARTMGSWRFIIIQSAILVAWMALNLTAWVRHWDPYPFILLNLALSTQAAYAAPVIMMSQNRQAQQDRRRDDIEADEVHHLTTLDAEMHEMNRRQLEILELLKGERP